jgi:ubiquinone/menaquinone biosynthesis C-methylase UbiE
MKPSGEPQSVIAANIAVHSAMAASYNEREPHFRPENKAKVREVLATLARRAGHSRLLDLGCGTGFIIDLAVDLFDEIHGVDITTAMLERVDTSSGKVVLHRQRCEELPFEDGTFDVVTAYSFLDHLADYSVVLAEAARVLRPGGILYADLLPNRRFWDEIHRLAEEPATEPRPAIVQREITMLRTQHLMVQQEYAIDADAFLRAEPWKTGTRGILAADLVRASRDAGFSAAEVSFQWYLGQGNVLHGQGDAEARLVEDYLRSVLPVAEHLFKYFRVILTR